MQFAKLQGDLDAHHELGTAVLGQWFSNFQVSEPTWRLGSRVRPKVSGDEDAADQGRTLDKQHTKEGQGQCCWKPGPYLDTPPPWAPGAGTALASRGSSSLFFLSTEIRFVGGSNVLN